MRMIKKLGGSERNQKQWLNFNFKKHMQTVTG